MKGYLTQETFETVDVPDGIIGSIEANKAYVNPTEWNMRFSKKYDPEKIQELKLAGLIEVKPTANPETNSEDAITPILDATATDVGLALNNTFLLDLIQPVLVKLSDIHPKTTHISYFADLRSHQAKGVAKVQRDVVFDGGIKETIALIRVEPKVGNPTPCQYYDYKQVGYIQQGAPLVQFTQLKRHIRSNDPVETKECSDIKKMLIFCFMNVFLVS